MSTVTAAHGFRTRRAAVRRPARRPASPRVRRPAPGVRLTRRGRTALTVLFLGLVLAGLTVFGAGSVATDEPGAPVRTRTVVVGEGDTLWGIAAEVAAPGEVREMVYRIEELNSLPGPALAEGQKIAVPVR